MAIKIEPETKSIRKSKKAEPLPIPQGYKVLYIEYFDGENVVFQLQDETIHQIFRTIEEKGLEDKPIFLMIEEDGQHKGLFTLDSRIRMIKVFGEGH